MNSGFVERKDTKLGKKRVQSYHLSIAGRKRAEKWFDKQIRKTGQFNNAPYLPEKRLDETIAPLPVVRETVNKKPKTDAEQEDILDLLEKLKGRWVEQKVFLDKNTNANFRKIVYRSPLRTGLALNCVVCYKCLRRQLWTTIDYPTRTSSG